MLFKLSLTFIVAILVCLDDVIKWKHFPLYRPFVQGIHLSPVNCLHKGQWRRALMFSLNSVWINSWINNRGAGDLRRHCTNYDVIVMPRKRFVTIPIWPAHPLSSFIITPTDAPEPISTRSSAGKILSITTFGELVIVPNIKMLCYQYRALHRKKTRRPHHYLIFITGSLYFKTLF